MTFWLLQASTLALGWLSLLVCELICRWWQPEQTVMFWGMYALLWLTGLHLNDSSSWSLDMEFSMDREVTHDQKCWCNFICSEVWITAFRKQFCFFSITAMSSSLVPSINGLKYPWVWQCSSSAFFFSDFLGTLSWHKQRVAQKLYFPVLAGSWVLSWGPSFPFVI